VVRAYSEALAPRSVLGVDDLASRFSLNELRKKCDEASTDVGTGSLDAVEPAVLSSGIPRKRATMLDADRERVGELEERLDALPDREEGFAAQQREHLEEQIADLRGERT